MAKKSKKVLSSFKELEHLREDFFKSVEEHNPAEQAVYAMYCVLQTCFPPHVSSVDEEALLLSRVVGLCMFLLPSVVYASPHTLNETCQKMLQVIEDTYNLLSKKI